MSNFPKAPKNAVSERVHQVPDGRGGFSELIEHEVKLDEPTGKVTVDLNDPDTGKVEERQEASNFIASQYTQFMRSWQRTIWSAFPYNEGSGGAGSARGLDWVTTSSAGRIPLSFPNQHIACWNDTSAEDSANEHRVNLTSTGIIAWAARYPTSGYAGSRGGPNISSSAWTDTGETMVYDWATTGGNGTFQSVGYVGLISNTSNVPYLYIRPSLLERRYIYAAQTGWMSGLANPIANAARIGQWGVDAAGDIVMVGGVGSTANAGCVKIPLAEWNYTPTVDVNGAAERLVPAPTSVYNNVAHGLAANSQMAEAFIGESGSRYWLYQQTGTTATRIVGVNKTTGAIERTGPSIPTAATNGGNNALAGCVIGTDAYVFSSATSGGGPVYKYDLTPGTPTLTATITPSPTISSYVYAACSDGTDIYFIGSVTGLIGSPGLYKMTTAGVVTLMGDLNVNFGNESITAPFNIASSNMYMGGNFDTTWFSRFGQPSFAPSHTGASTLAGTQYRYYRQSSCTPTFAASIANANMYSIFCYGGKLYYSKCNTTSSNPTTMLICELGWNLGSRALLGAPVVKTSANTMKITYNVTLPSIV